MPEQIIDIRERIEKMRIKFEDDKKLINNDNIIKENNVSQNNFNNRHNDNIKNKNKLSEEKTIKNSTLEKREVHAISDDKFPSVSLSVKNPISSKILVILMLLQVFSNIGIFVLLFNVLE